MSTPEAASSRAPASDVERAIYLRWFLGPDVGAAAAEVVGFAREVAFREDERVYEEGGPSDAIYLIIEGTVELVSPEGRSWFFHARDGVGFLDALMGRPHARTAVARAFVRALRLDFDDWMDFLEDNFHLSQGAVISQARSLHDVAKGLAPDGGFPTPAPSNGRNTTSFVDLLAALRANPVFFKASMQALVVLARLAEPRELQADEVLFAAGGERGLFMVLDGLIESRGDDPELVARFGAGTLVHGLAPLMEGGPPITARAVEPTRVVRLRDEDLFDVMEDHFDVARSMMGFLAMERERLLFEIEARGGRAAVHA
jgi:CRP-like cAMP-binding protein